MKRSRLGSYRAGSVIGEREPLQPSGFDRPCAGRVTAFAVVAFDESPGVESVAKEDAGRDQGLVRLALGGEF
jgi:hypothetical protein